MKALLMKLSIAAGIFFTSVQATAIPCTILKATPLDYSLSPYPGVALDLGYKDNGTNLSFGFYFSGIEEVLFRNYADLLPTGGVVKERLQDPDGNLDPDVIYEFDIRTTIAESKHYRFEVMIINSLKMTVQIKSKLDYQNILSLNCNPGEVH